MNDEVITDLKQFISATVGQHSARLESKIDKVEGRLTRVENRLTAVENRLTSVEDHVFAYISTVDEQVQNHEKRLVTIEK